ncbi:hypothetical protein [Jannaschia sp. R86511]|uniref:hypothetical protein n=1 Tax=Jannaschia sp. R86511 TaxID=3093853 RepID=UPI0036D254E5
MVSFLANPSRDAVTPEGALWHVRLVRGNAWRGWPGQRELLQKRIPLDPGGINLRMVLVAYSLPIRGALWAAYRLRQRTDWRVVVRRGEAESDREAAHEERLPTKDAAAARAMELVVALREGHWKPPSLES